MDLDKMEGKNELGRVLKLTVFINPIGENYTKEYSERRKNHYLVPQKKRINHYHSTLALFRCIIWQNVEIFKNKIKSQRIKKFCVLGKGRIL
jgi:hypothetical protein